MIVPHRSNPTENTTFPATTTYRARIYKSLSSAVTNLFTSFAFRQPQIFPFAPLSTPEEITTLDLSNNAITIVPDMKNLTALTSLDLSYNQISYPPPTTGHLQTLTILDISHNALRTPPGTQTLTALLKLDLSYNTLIIAPETTFWSFGNLYG